jgi:carboxypeptidase PM20D1
VSHDDRTRFDAEAFLAFHRFLEASYPRVHAQTDRQVINDYSLVYHLQGSEPELEPVLFMGHFDVVPVDPATAEAWRFDPFSGVQADGHIWGRGSLDDKLGVIALLEAVEQLLAEGFSPRRSIYLAFGHDEEVGGLEGARQIAHWFAERGTRFGFVLDEGGIVTEGIFEGVDRPVAVIGVAEKGWVNLRLTVGATGGHSSQPPPHTAVGLLSQAIVRLEDKPFPASLDFMGMTIEPIAHAMPWTLRAVFANSWLFEPLLLRYLLRDPGDAASLRTTTAVTMVSGSPKSNILPTRAEAVVNFRIIPGETAESVQARVERIIDDERVQITADTHWDPSPVAPLDSAGYRLIAGTLRGLDPDILVAPYVVRGGTDARYFYELSNHVYRFLMARASPETIEMVHGINEHVAVADYLDAIRFYYAMIRRAADGPLAAD